MLSLLPHPHAPMNLIESMAPRPEYFHMPTTPSIRLLWITEKLFLLPPEYLFSGIFLLYILCK